MDRKIVYPGQIPLETDLLLTNKFALTGMARLAEVMLGSNTCLYGFECRPGQGKPLSVHVSEGQIYHREETDRTSFSTLGSDNETKILKQGYSQAQDFELTPPNVPGQSLCYLLQMKYIDEDTGDTVLPYYNATHPAAGFSGPDNSGKAQHTVRAGRCIVVLKPGLPVTTGTQQAPHPDPDFVGAWIITIRYGAVMITAQDIVVYPDAPYIPREGIITALQQGVFTTGKDRGMEDRYHVFYQPPVKNLTDGQRLFFRAKNTNSGPCTLKVNNLPEYKVLSVAGRELGEAEINSGQLAEVEWNENLSTWILHQKGYSKAELLANFLPLKGGVIDGKLEIKEEFQVGGAKLLKNGNVEGDCWKNQNGSEKDLHSWLKGKTKITGGDYGWCYYDNVSGLIVYGGIAKRKNQSTIVSFPAKFPSKCLAVNITFIGNSAKSSWNGVVANTTNTSFEILLGNDEREFYWQAIGY